MSDGLKIKEVQKYEKQISDNTRSIVNNTKFLILFGTLIFASIKMGCDSETEELMMASSVLFGTVNVISIVKSLCKNYNLKERIKNIENEDRQK